MAKPKHYCCTSRPGVYSPEQPARPVVSAAQRDRLLGKHPLTELAPDGSDAATPNEAIHDPIDMDNRSKSRLSFRLKERLSFGQYSRKSRVLIKTPRKQSPKIHKPSMFEAFLDRRSLDLDLDDQRTPSRGGYDADARLISETQLLDGTLIAASEVTRSTTSPEDTCHTDVTNQSSADATSSSNGVSLTTPAVTSSSTPGSTDDANSFDGYEPSAISWSEDTGEVEYLYGRDHTARPPQAPRLELRGLSKADLSMDWPVSEDPRVGQAPQIRNPTREYNISSPCAGQIGEVLWDAEREFQHADDKPENVEHEIDLLPSRASVHLNDMRISQHLRSMSSLSKDSYDVPPGGLRHTPHQSIASAGSPEVNTAEDARKESFQSETVPHTWGRVVSRNRSPENVEDIPRTSSTIHNQMGSDAGLDTADLPRFSTESSDKFNALETLRESTNCAGQFLHASDDPHGAFQNLAMSVFGPLPDNDLDPDLKLQDQATEPAKDPKSTPSASPRSARRKSFGHLIDRNRFFDHAPKFRLKVGNKKSKTSFDGTSESPSLSSHLEDGTLPTVTVGSNYEETSNVWEKALNAHSIHVAEGRGNSSRTPHRMSFSAMRKSRLSVAIAPDEPTNGRAKSRQSIGFRPMEMEHSFDRLPVPGNPALVRTRHLTETLEKAQPAERTSLHGRQRSRSQPAAKYGTRGRERERRTHDSYDHSSFEQSTIKDTSATVTAHGRPTSALDTWSRYPSHTRSLRSLSAGAADCVITKDFAAGIDASDEESQLDPMEKKKQRRKHRNGLARTALIRKTLLTDLPAMFRPFTTGFRKGESGHRSSIAVGGTLEYPELELLPAGEDAIGPTVEDAHAKGASQGLEASGDGIIEHLLPSSVTQTDYLQTPTTKRLISATKSSMYDSSGSDYNGEVLSQVSSTRVVDQHLSASDWSRVYGELVTDIGTHARTSKDGGSVTDGVYGAGSDQALLTSTSSMPCLSTTRATALTPVARLKLTKSCSVEPMRLSTQNLIDMLDNGVEGDIARALRSAETAWNDGSI